MPQHRFCFVFLSYVVGMCGNNTGERFLLIAFDRNEAKLKLTGRKVK